MSSSVPTARPEIPLTTVGLEYQRDTAYARCAQLPQFVDLPTLHKPDRLFNLANGSCIEKTSSGLKLSVPTARNPESGPLYAELQADSIVKYMQVVEAQAVDILRNTQIQY